MATLYFACHNKPTNMHVFKANPDHTISHMLRSLDLYDGQLNSHLQHCFSVVAVMEHPVGLMRTTARFLASRFGLQQSTSTLCIGYSPMAAYNIAIAGKKTPTAIEARN
jgi:hypothetical protein